MGILRSERAAAVLLLAAAFLGLVLANTPAAATVFAITHIELGPVGTPWRLDLAHWVSEGLLAVFFLVAAIELRHELTHGTLRSPARAIRPAIAAAGGVIAPIAIYLAITAGSGQEHGWPVPTATDIAFALGVLAMFGRGLPAGLRAFLLALAILDDIVGIIFIAVVFAHGVEWLPLLLAAVAVVAFGVLGALLSRRRKGADGEDEPLLPRWAAVLVVIAMIALAIVAWAATVASGVHATIAGVALGLSLSPRPAHALRHGLEPVVNGAILPVFAFAASLVTIPQVPASGLAPAFWGIAIGLPVGKLVGIAGFTWIADRFLTRDPKRRMRFGDLATAGALGGIGFTVSLLMAHLAFANSAELTAEATLAVLAGSAVSIIAAAILVTIRAAGYRRIRRLRERVLNARHRASVPGPSPSRPSRRSGPGRPRGRR